MVARLLREEHIRCPPNSDLFKHLEHDIDDVRLHSRALAGDEVTTLI
jgi:hypothetical protein